MRYGFAILALALLLPLPANAQFAEIYRTVGEDGSVTFTNVPPPGTPAASGGRSSRRDRPIATPPSRPNPNPDRDPNAFDSIIREAAEAYGIPFSFIKAVIRAESAFDPYAVSPVGAQGLMQLMPATARSLNCQDPFDPRDNIMAGTQYLRLLSERYGGNPTRVLAAYNSGPGTVHRSGDMIPYEATARYIDRVLRFREDYEAASE